MSKEEEEEFLKFIELLQNLQVNISLAEKLKKMPVYAKFMKELLSRKRGLPREEAILLTEDCSAIIQNRIPQKKTNPGSFTIPCSIGNLNINKELCYLGASINLMSLSMMKKLGNLVVKPARMMLSLVDRSIKHPYGIVEDVLVKVGRFVFPVDFVIMDMKEDSEYPLLLERLFLATGRAMIDMEAREVMLRIKDEHIKFNVFDVQIPNQGEVRVIKCKEVMEDMIEELEARSGSTDHLERVVRDSSSKEDLNLDQETEEILEQLNSPQETDPIQQLLIKLTILMRIPLNLRNFLNILITSF